MTETPDAVRQFNATTNAAVAQARQLAKDTVSQIDAGTFGLEAWNRSMVKFFDIIARGSATHFKTAVAHGCCPRAQCQGECACGMHPVHVSVPADQQYSRKLTVQVQFQQVGGDETIPANQVAFVSDILAPGDTTFSMRLLDAHYMGASYTGTVRLTRITANLAPAAYTDEVVTVEL